MTIRSNQMWWGAASLVAAMAAAAVATGQGTQFLGPTPYLSAADSPFDVVGSPHLYALEDFECGEVKVEGVTFGAGAIKGPGPTTSSVDADTSVIDGSGNGGHSWSVSGGLLNIFFNQTVLGGYPTEVGIVWTDGFPGGGVTFVAIDGQGNLIGSVVHVLGSEETSGTTADDRFVGVIHPPGISAITVIPVSGQFQVDHLQFKRPVPIEPVIFTGPLPYLSGADSPFGISRPRLDAVLEDFEDGFADAPGVTMTLTEVRNPGTFTDSVDGDTGAIDGSGSKGRSALLGNANPLAFDFDSAKLGGYPTQFGVVITDLLAGPHHVKVRVFGPDGELAGERCSVMIGDEFYNGTTDEDRFFGAEYAPGISRVELWLPGIAIEYDHVQYNLPVERNIAFLGPKPYLSAADSLFDLSEVGYNFVLEDFESGTLQAPGLSINLDQIRGPGATTDSVDADTGVIDGFGNQAHAALRQQNPLVLDWNAAVLGGLPTQVGLVLTDWLAGPMNFTVRAYDQNLQQIGGTKVYNLIGDAFFNGTTAEDRFIGVESAIGIRRLTVWFTGGALEFDHVQYNLPNPIENPFTPATPYLSLADSPLFLLLDDDLSLYWEDFEDGSFDLPGTTINLDMIKGPGPTTDSVDADTGAIDGSGNDGHSAVKFEGAPLVIVFDDAIIGSFPIAAGLAWTDCGPGIANVTMEAYDGDGALIASKTYYSLGDNLDNGATEEDRFLGIAHAGGISELRLTSNRLIEFDHVQFVAATIPPDEVVGDLNGDGVVDGADLGILLNNWGECAGCEADLNGDGVVDGADLGILLNNWGS